MPPLLSISDLHVEFDTPEGIVHAVEGVALDISAGETLGLVGESGCGKSVTAMSILRLVPNPPGRIVSGTITFDGRDIATLSLPELRKLRGAAIGMVFQDPMTALSPLHKIGSQLVEAIRLHQPMSRRDALTLAEEWLVKAGIRDPKRCLCEYPFRLSGGQQQRVMIASVLMTNPRLIVADEPTTALDVTIQAQVLERMRTAKGRDTALLLITHNMGIVWNTCSRIAVMYAGEIVEEGPVKAVFKNPGHPYTQALLDALPSKNRRGERLVAIPGSVPSPLAFPAGCRFHERCAYAVPECSIKHPALLPIGNNHFARCPVWAKSPIHVKTNVTSEAENKLPPSVQDASKPPNNTPTGPNEPVLETRHLHKHFKTVHAVNDVCMTLHAGETFAIVGESGCGKTTLARMLVGLEKPTGGEILLDGQPIPARRPFAMMRDLQMIFQDPFSSLNPRMTVADIITEAAVVHGLVKRSDRLEAAKKLLAQVGMSPEVATRYPHAFSGGQRQRISIARAIALKPRIILCDEPVSALDVSVQAQILNLLSELQRELQPAYLFITHDIGVVRHMAHRIAIMYDGKIVEEGPAESILENPSHDYTKTLLAAEPRITL